MIRTIDLNARIIDLDYKVDVINGHPLARIRFQNLYFGTIKALKVKIIGFNSFEEPVMVNDKLDYIALIQDIEINSGQNAENITIDIPNTQIFIVRNGVKSAVTSRQGQNLRPIYDQIREHVQIGLSRESPI